MNIGDLFRQLNRELLVGSEVSDKLFVRLEALNKQEFITIADQKTQLACEELFKTCQESWDSISKQVQQMIKEIKDKIRFNLADADESDDDLDCTITSGTDDDADSEANKTLTPGF